MSGCHDSDRKDNEMDYTKIFEQINDCVDKLEFHLYKLRNYAHHKNDKKPHKCPVCDFSGAIMLENMEEVSRFGCEVMKTSDGKFFIWCKSCEGTALVWG